MKEKIMEFLKLPKVWFYDCLYGKEYRNFKNSSHIMLSARFGRWTSSHNKGEINDDIHILPCLCIHFNSSEVHVRFAWLNFECWVTNINYKKEDEWRERIKLKINKNKEI